MWNRSEKKILSTLRVIFSLCLLLFPHQSRLAYCFGGLTDISPSTLSFIFEHPVATSTIATHHISSIDTTFENINSLFQGSPTTTTSELLSSSASATNDLLSSYKGLLKSHPLPTKMVTGGTLAVCGDFIAQYQAEKSISDEEDKNTESWYDVPRAVSFFIFDMAYRALQHFSFPIIVAECQGQYLLSLLTPFASIGALNLDQVSLFSATMEQTLASQLGIVPFLYYPVFFSLTGAIQGLTVEESIERAIENFPKLMKRNLLFWIPVQFVQFGFIPIDLQIPFLSLAGLAWTFILSIIAGAANKKDESSSIEVDVSHDEKFYPIMDETRASLGVLPDSTITQEDVELLKQAVMDEVEVENKKTLVKQAK